MKNIVYIATLFLIIAGLSGCEKEIKDFDGEEGVYFYVQWGLIGPPSLILKLNLLKRV